MPRDRGDGDGLRAVAPPAVQVRELSAGYRELVALRGVSFALEPLRISAFLGPGGGGKSTLLRILAGEAALHPELWVSGGVLVSLAGARRLPQKPESDPRTLAGLLGGRRLADVWREAPAAAAFLEPTLDVPVGTLPYDLGRLAGITAALASVAPLLLLDEPEAGLECEQQGWIAAELRALRGRRTVVLATHHLEFARSVADCAHLLVRGELLEAAEVPAFFDSPVHPRTRHYVRMGG